VATRISTSSATPPAYDTDRLADGVSRIATTFARLRLEKRLGLLAYLTVGYPTIDATPALVEAAVGEGADAIELGIPFSDPLADGRTIQAASQIALKAGITVRRALEVAALCRASTDVPLLFMTYLNPILAFGLDRFCERARAVGIDGLIVPDLPAGDSDDLRSCASAAGLDTVFFVSPTSNEAGIQAACQAATGFVYCVAVTGTTGARAQLDAAVLPLIDSVRRHTRLPIVVGFGISRPAHLAALEGHADGAIVASALLDAIGEAPDDAANQVRRFLRGLRTTA
jgi:tryptophan synthase alpha chain